MKGCRELLLVLDHILCLEGILSLSERATILPQIKGVEGVAVMYDTIPKLLLEEIVVVSMHIQHCTMPSPRSDTMDEGRYDGS